MTSGAADVLNEPIKGQHEMYDEYVPITLTTIDKPKHATESQMTLQYNKPATAGGTAGTATQLQLSSVTLGAGEDTLESLTKELNDDNFYNFIKS